MDLNAMAQRKHGNIVAFSYLKRLILFVTLLVCSAGIAQQPSPKIVRPATVEARLSTIRTLLQSKRTAEALRMATELSSANAADFHLQYDLGVLLASENQFRPALLELRRADSLQPGTFEVPYILGQALLRSGDYTNAEITLDRALKLKPESPDVLYLMAQVYSGEARPLDALELLVHASKIAPENPDILFLMAQISIAQKFFEDAISPLEKALKIAPGRNEFRAALAESYYKSAKVEKAIENFKQLVAVEPSARSYAYLGLSYIFLGRFDEAKHDFQDGLRLDPKNTFCLFHLGSIARLQGDTITAEATFQKVLRANPDFPDALLELADLRIESNRYPEAVELLRKYVRVSINPATGYYKLAMVEKKNHDMVAAERDLAEFQLRSKNVTANSYPYEDLFNYVEKRSKLDTSARKQQDLADLIEQYKKHPDQLDVLYPLAEAYLKAGKIDEAKETLAQLETRSISDYRTLTGVGVLLARYHLYDDAIGQFQAAIQANPGFDEAYFDLANAYFTKGLYEDALNAAMRVSPDGRKDDSYLALLGDIYAHQGKTREAADIFRSAITRNPDNDQNYLSLALLQFRASDFAGAKQTLLQGQAHVPGSGKIIWGLGLASALEGNTLRAAEQLEHAVDLLPQWPGSYSTLGVFYFQTGQIDRAKEVLDRFKNSSSTGALDVNRIEQVLAQAPTAAPLGNAPLSSASKKQLLQLALFLADKTL